MELSVIQVKCTRITILVFTLAHKILITSISSWHSFDFLCPKIDAICYFNLSFLYMFF